GFLALSLADRGEFAEAAALADEAVRIAQSVEEPFSVCLAHWAAGAVRLARGDLRRAIPVLERGLESGRTWQIGLLVPYLTSNLGYAYALSERIVEGLSLLEPDTSFVRSQYDQRLAWLAEAYLLDGRLGEAARTAERAVEVTRGYQQRGF